MNVNVCACVGWLLLSLCCGCEEGLLLLDLLFLQACCVWLLVFGVLLLLTAVTSKERERMNVDESCRVLMQSRAWDGVYRSVPCQDFFSFDATQTRDEMEAGSWCFG